MPVTPMDFRTKYELNRLLKKQAERDGTPWPPETPRRELISAWIAFLAIIAALIVAVFIFA